MRPGEYADTLRALAGVLATEGAVGLSVLNFADEVIATWHTARGPMAQRRFRAEEIAALRAQATARRGVGDLLQALGQRLMPELTPPLAPPRTELLRTLGQVLDEHGVDLDAVLESPDGFRVVGSLGGTRHDGFYHTSDLAARSQQQRVRRVDTGRRV